MKFLNFKFWQYLFFYNKIERILKNNEYDSAITMLENYLKDKLWCTVDIYYLLGKAHYGKKNYEKAIKSFEAFLEYNEYNDIYKSNTLFYLGLSFDESDDYENAIKVFSEAIEIKKKMKLKIQRDIIISLPNLYCYLGRCYVNLDDKQTAFSVFNEGLKYEPDNEALHRELTLLGIG